MKSSAALRGPYRFPVSPETPAMPARGIHHEDIANLRYRMVEVERRSAAWRCEEYRMLLEQFCGNVGQSAAQTELEGGQPVDSSSSQSAPATPSGLTPQQQQVLPSLMAWQDDDNRECHQGSVFTAVCIWIASSQRSYFSCRTSASPELVPPGRVRHRLDNEEVFVGTVAALCADNSSRNRSAIFSLAGLCDHQLTSLEAAWDKKTPDMPWLTFAKVFGRTLYSERPLAEKVKGYVGSFLCTNNVVQPFAPKRVGEPGVILFPPGTVLLEDTKERFHVLVDLSADQRTRLQYRGIYTKVHTPSIMEVQPDEWHALPRQVSNFSTSSS